MAGTTLGYLKFILGFDTVAFRKGMTEAEKDLTKLQKKIEKFGKGMADVGKTMSLGITAPLAAFAAVGVKEAQETAEAMAQVTNGIQSMGGASGKTAADLKALADEMQMHSLYEADEILRKVTTNLLTFGNISGPTFDRAQQAVVDLATKMNTDLQSAALLVGKALNDPVKGMTAMGKAGIQFTASQKLVIKNLVETGQLASAQAIIMKELERQFSGSAQAAQDVDPYNRLSDAFKNVAESVGVILLPMLTKIADQAVALADGFMSLSPTTQNLALGFLAVVAAVGPALYLVGNFIALMAGVKAVALFTQGLLGLAAAEGVAASGAVAAGVAFRSMLGPIGLVLTAVGAVYLAWRNWEKISAIAAAVYRGVSTFLGPQLTAVLNALLIPIRAVIWGFNALMNLVGKPAGAKPKMITDIATATAQLNYEFSDANKVAPKAEAGIAKVGKAAKAAKPPVDQLAESGKRLWLELYPERARQLKFDEDEKALRHLKLSADETADAIARLNAQRSGEESDVRIEAARKAGIATDEELPDWFTDSEALGFTKTNAMGSIVDPMDEVVAANREALKTIGDMTGETTMRMTQAWGDMAAQAVYDLKGMVAAFKSGDILGGIQQLLDTLLNVIQAMARLGVFGGGAQAGAGGSGFAYGGARAMGGPVVPGKSYMVGENGPEWFSTKRSGVITPNAKNAQPQRVVVVPSPYFDVVVDQRAANVAAPMAGKAAIIGVTGSEQRSARRSRRNLYATG